MQPVRLAIIATHPIQYYAPWFAYLAKQDWLELKVFYLWNAGVANTFDPGFSQNISWDIPLLEGYESTFVDNKSSKPGTSSFWGLHNPSLKKQLLQYEPNVIFCMAYRYRTFLELFYLWNNCKCPVLFRGDSHRLLPRSGFISHLKRVFTTSIFRRINAFLYVGSANREYYRMHGVGEEQMFFAPHAVDNERFSSSSAEISNAAKLLKEDLGISQDEKVILFVGKFIEKKRPADLLSAFKQAKLKQAVLLFVGSGRLEEVLREQAAAAGNVYFLPFQNQSEMPKVYALADLLVLPSDTESETWGLVVNEAMACGLPAIVSDQVGCWKDLVRDGETGYVFPAGNIAALTSALVKIFSEDIILEQLGERAKLLIENYSYAAATNGLREALKYLDTPEALA